MALRTDDAAVVDLTETQAMVHIIRAKTTYVLAQRAGGKTSGVIGPRIDHLQQVMPRCQILLGSDSFERLQDRIVPGILTFLENKMGLIEDVDYVKYKKPPAEFDKPYMKLDKFDKVISFANGTALCLVSLKVPGSANAYSAQAMIFDELKFCDEKQINSEVLPSLRGMEDMYGHLPEYRSQLYLTDKYGPKVKWILAKKKLMDEEMVQSVYSLQLEISRLEALMEDAQTEAMYNHYYYRIKELDDKLSLIRKRMIYYADMKPFENLPHVGAEYFRDMKRTCGSFEYDVAILNKDPEKVEHSFYPFLSKQNIYNLADDVDKGKPFIVSFDYNFRIVPMVCAQKGVLPGAVYNTLNIVRGIHQLYPLGTLEVVIKDFCDTYKHHHYKYVHYVHDHTAIGRNATGSTYRDVVTKAFEDNGWTVNPVYIGGAPEHDIKFRQVNHHLQAYGDGAIRINQSTNEYLIKSMEQAAAEISNGKTRKSKKTETDLNFPAEEAPHYSDAFDMLVWADCEMKLISSNTDTPIDITARR